MKVVNMTVKINRRRFVAIAGTVSLATMTPGLSTAQSHSEPSRPQPLFNISLAEWSLHRMIFDQKLITNLDFPRVAKEAFGIQAIEYVNQFFRNEVGDDKYMTRLKQNCEDHGVKSMLIMVDGEGQLGDADDKKRKQAVENHRKWLEAAKFLGCHSIRVNAASEGSYEEQIKLAADGLSRLCELGSMFGLNVIVENHGGLSSNGGWLAQVIRLVDRTNCGTLPDFGNFQIKDDQWYDRYQGVEEMMPFAKAVSAKTHDFDEHGNEKNTDYMKMMKIVLDAGYRGYVGIEFEGTHPEGEYGGILATKRLLERCREKLASNHPS